jgi:MFS family permease
MPRAAVPLVAALVAVATVAAWTRRADFPLLNDDVAYLGSACAMARLESLEWGPAYAAAYCGLKHVVPDPFAAFWLKQALVLLLAGLLVCLLGRRFGLGPVIAPLVGLWCVLGLLSPNGTLEAAFVLGLAACLCAASDTRAGWTGFFLVMGLAFLVRTEYVIGIAVALTLLAWRAYRAQAEVRSGVLAGSLVLAGCLTLAWGAPGHRDRSWFAFGQQFAVNHAEAFGASGDPLVDWPRIAAQSFPGSDSIGEAARENPRVFAWHLRYNLLNRVPRALGRLLLPIPYAASWASPWAALLGGAAAATVLAATVWGALQTAPRGGSRLTGILALAAVPLASLAFRPQARHWLPLLPLVLLLAGRGLGAPTGSARTRLRAIACVLCGMLLLAGAIAPWATWALTPRPKPSVEDRLRELREHGRIRPVHVAAAWYADRICALVGPQCQVVALGQDRSPDAVVVDPRAIAEP